MDLNFGNLISVLLGGLLVFLGQWFVARQSAIVELKKTEKDEFKQLRKDIVSFRQERAVPVLKALDRAALRWDTDSIVELADCVGYTGEKFSSDTDEYKQQRKEQKRTYFKQMQDDLTSVSVIHDPALRSIIDKVLWHSIDPDNFPDKPSATLQEAYLKLEKWIYDPKLE